ncbi:MAG: hypothetical protein ACI867_001728 [Glaciecola sp.]|jgi:hypothetical protein
MTAVMVQGCTPRLTVAPFKALADLIEEHLDTDLLRRLAGLN